MSDCANEAMADPNGLNLPLTEGAVGSNDTMISNFDSAYTTSTNMHRMSSGAGAAAAQLDPKYVIAHQGPIGSTSQQHTAAAFFASKKASSSYAKHNIIPSSSSPLHQTTNGNMSSQNNSKDTKTNNRHHRVCDYSTVLSKCPPPTPSSLLKKMEVTEVSGLGKVRVVLRVANSGIIDDSKPGNSSFFQMDKKKKQVTIFDPTLMKNDAASNPSNNLENSDRRVDVAAPKMFAFDGLFTDEDSQNDVSTCALTDTIHSVVNGTDGCLFCFGHANLGKTYTMIGSDESSKTLGVIPSAIAWLYRCIKEKKDKSGTKFSIRVSAFEIGGAKEDVRDLLQFHESDSDQDSSGAPPPSAFIPHKVGSNMKNSSALNHPSLLQNLTELRSPSADKAGYFLDSALTARSTNMAADESGRDSHFIFTLHVYQYAMDKGSSSENSNIGGINRKAMGNNVIGGRSRLHLIDFGGCERTKSSGGGITLSGLGNVILAIFNGQRHLPCKESRVTSLLKECLGSLSCQATMIAHISPLPSNYSETLHTTQLASRIHRMRRKKSKGSGGSGGGSGSGSSDEKTTKLVKLLPGSGTSSSDITTGTSTDPSSSEQSCDTVIYVGSRDDEGTDAEHPPVFIPNLDSADARGNMANVLRGSTAELPKHSNASKKSRKSTSSTLERRRQSKSPASSLSNHKILSTARLRPGSVGSTPVHSISQSHGRSNSSKKSPQNSSSPLTLSQNSHNSHLMAQYNMGRGSLPRNPRGKMPLYGKVAGYRQPASNSNAAVVAQEYWIDQKGASKYHSESTKVNKQPSCMSQNPQIMVMPYPCPMNMLSTPSHQGSGGSPCHEYPYSLEQQAAIYGYMDDHKINMIQHWVECQTKQMKNLASSPVHQLSNHQKSPIVLHPQQILSNPSHFQIPQESQQEPVPFAWLNQPQTNDHADENGCKVLTQFKTVDSSDDSFSDGAQPHLIEQHQNNKEYSLSKKRSSQTHSHSGGSASHSVVAADIHVQPRSNQNCRTSKFSSDFSESSNYSTAKHNSFVLPEDLSSGANVYSSIDRKSKHEVKQPQMQLHNHRMAVDNECGQGDIQQPIYATINHEKKRNKNAGTTLEKRPFTAVQNDNNASISYHNENAKSDNDTLTKSITSSTNGTKEYPATLSKEGKLSEGVNVGLPLDISQKEHSSHNHVHAASSSENAFSKTIDSTNESHANLYHGPNQILVKRDCCDGQKVDSSSKCCALSYSKDENLLSETRNGSATVVEQQLSNMNSLDELYNHCEQLVETLSQASEDIMHMEREEYLQVFKRKSSSITKEEVEKIPDIHQTEILLESDEYEEIQDDYPYNKNSTIQETFDQGTKRCFEEVNSSQSGNQVKEEEKLKSEFCEKDQQKVNMVGNARLNNQNQTKPLQTHDHKQESQPHRMLSEENLATTVSSLDGQALHYVGNKNKLFEQKKYNFIKDMKAAREAKSHNLANTMTLRDPAPPSMFEMVDETFGNIKCDSVSTDGIVDHEKIFTKKFDQLAKLNELYQSVSSISAKSQSHLDAAQLDENNMCNYNGGLRGSTLSLSALLNDLERASIGDGCSNADSDVNSLCSEPVKMYDYNDFVDLNKNNTLSAADIFDDICGNKNSLSDMHAQNEKMGLQSMYQNKSTLSLCEIGLNKMSIEDRGEKNGGNKLCFYSSEVNVNEDRSDSPILEEIDQELAKYAKLKDLKHAYDPNTTTPSNLKSTPSNSTTKNEVIVQHSGHKDQKGEVKIDEDQVGISNTQMLNKPSNDSGSGGLSTLLRQPDGASDPDLNYKLPSCNNNNNNNSNVSNSSNNASTAAVSTESVPSVILHQNKCTLSSKSSASPYDNGLQANNDSNQKIMSLEVNPKSNVGNKVSSNDESFDSMEICDRRSPGNGQSGSDPEPEHLEMLNYHQIKNNEMNVRSSNLHRRNDGIQASTSSSSSLSTSATSASNYSRDSKTNNNNLNTGYAVIHRYGRGMQLSSRNERTIVGKSQSTTDCDTSSEHEIWIENKASTLSHAKAVNPPTVEDKTISLTKGSNRLHDNSKKKDNVKNLNQNSSNCLNDNNKNEILSMQKSKAPKFSRLFKLSRSPLKIVKVQSKVKVPCDITNNQEATTNKNHKKNEKNNFCASNKRSSTQHRFSNGKTDEKKTFSSNGNLNNFSKEPHHYHHTSRDGIKSSAIDAKISSGSSKRIGGDSNNKNLQKGFKDIHQSSPTLLSSPSHSPVRSNNRHSQESKNAKGTSSSESLRANKNGKDSDPLFRPSPKNKNMGGSMTKQKHEINHHKKFFVLGKKSTSGKGTKTNQQTSFSEKEWQLVTSVPSPYSFATKPRLTSNGLKQDRDVSSGSEYDSGHDSGIVSAEAAIAPQTISSSNSKAKTSSFIKTCKFVKLRSNKGGRGGANSLTKASLSSLHSTNASSPNSPSQKKKNRASHCKSSGYESSAGERDSIGSIKGGIGTKGCNISPLNSPIHESSNSSEKHVLTKTPLGKSLCNKSSILTYDEEFIDRLDKRWRFDEVRRLRQSQNCLKQELTKAKDRIGADPKRWSFELHVEENLGNTKAEILETDPTFVEALTKETTILEKRVDACKSHAILQTCFDYHPPVTVKLLESSILEDEKKSSSSLSSLLQDDKQNVKSIIEGKERSLSPLTQKLFDNCCTTDCEPAQDMILPSTTETEIF